MFPGINPKQMQAVMKQMGMSQVEIPTSRVIIEKEDGNKIVINNPSVTKIKMQGQESFQITGDVSDEPAGVRSIFSEDDIKVVMEKTNCSEDEAKSALEETGDLAEAILKLS
jgi:nascent polypeptide-associated complex subunit alpha